MPPRITFVGTGEAADPDLPNTSILYRGARTILCDCGYGATRAFWDVSRDPDLLDAIYITHRHADHSFGLPGLLLWMWQEGRTRPLTIFSGPGVDEWLDELLDLAYPGLFERDDCYTIEPVAVSPEAPHAYGDITIRCAPSGHSVRNLSVRIEEDGRSFCYSGDGEPTEHTRALYRATDVLVHECYADTAVVPGHADAEQLVEMARELEVRRLCLLHLGVPFKAAIRRDYDGRATFPAPGETIEIG